MSSKSKPVFVWEPGTFENAKDMVRIARLPAPNPAPGVTSNLIIKLNHDNWLPCPAPSTDPSGIYRVVLDENELPKIQRKAPAGWEDIP